MLLARAKRPRQSTVLHSSSLEIRIAACKALSWIRGIKRLSAACARPRRRFGAWKVSLWIYAPLLLPGRSSSVPEKGECFSIVIAIDVTWTWVGFPGVRSCARRARRLALMPNMS